MGLLDAPFNRNLYLAKGAASDRLHRADRALRGVHVGEGCYPGQIAGLHADAGGTSRTLHYIPNDISDPRLVYTNWYVGDTPTPGTDIDGPTAITVGASFRIGTVNYPVTFSGRLVATIDPGGMVISDPVALELAAGTKQPVVTYCAPTSGTTWYGTVASFSGGATGGFIVATDRSGAGAAAVVDSTGWLYGPSAILGTPKDRTKQIAVMILGDSRFAGASDNLSGSGAAYSPYYSTGLNGGGYVVRALHAAGVPWINFAHNSSKALDQVVQGAHFRKMALANGCTHAIVGYPINDVTQPFTLAQIQASVLSVWTFANQRLMVVWATTCEPKTTSTDGWASLANQTVTAQESVRVAYNNWLRDGAPILAGVAVATGSSAAGTLRAGATGHPLTGYFEVADTLESSRDSGKWIVSPTARSVTDGAVSSGSATFTSATAAFTSGDTGGTIYVAGAAAAGGALTTTMTYVNATTVTLAVNASTTVSGAVTGVNAKYTTTDGLHANVQGNTLAAAGITPASLVLPVAA